MSKNAAFKLFGAEEELKIARELTRDLESFSVVDDKSDRLYPVVCAVCDSIPDCAQWHTFVAIKQAQKWFDKCCLLKKDIADEYCESNEFAHDKNPLIAQYTTRYRGLNDFVLSPMTFVNEQDKILVCNECKHSLEQNSKKAGRSFSFMPEHAIGNNRLIGNAPECITKLSKVSLSLISIARIYCQSWVFFGGCHQHIKGWHTFYKNRPSENAGNLMQIRDSGMRGNILVVLCGPFTSTQKAMTLEACSVNPQDIVNALRWLIDNNVQYKNETIPHVDEIPVPHVIYENL